MRSTGPALAALLLLAAPAVAEEEWYPSRYGAGDTLGAIHELSPDKVLEAAKLVRTGKSYALGVETGRDTPAYGTRRFELYAVGNGDGSGATMGDNRATFNDDWMLTWLGIGTQIDGLGHFGIDHRYYNGTPVAEFWRSDGLVKFGIHELPAIVTRGVLLDIAGLSGVSVLPAGTVIGSGEIEAAEKRQGVVVGRGDVVILHTGWQRVASVDPGRFLAGEPGLGVDGARALAARRVVAVGADSWGLEASPGEVATEVFPVHQELLTRNGVYILENIRTDELVADEAWEFLFVLGAPRFVGAVQMVVNPVAIR